jgi:hypothetical protein
MTIKTMTVAAMLIVAGAGTALAQDAGPPPAGGGRMAACREDAKRLCPDKTGPDRRDCMKANKDKVSDACKAALAARR